MTPQATKVNDLIQAMRKMRVAQRTCASSPRPATIDAKGLAERAADKLLEECELKQDPGIERIKDLIKAFKDLRQIQKRTRQELSSMLPKENLFDKLLQKTPATITMRRQAEEPALPQMTMSLEEVDLGGHA